MTSALNENPMSPELVAWGATYTPAEVEAGQSFWKLIIADGPMNIGGNHHLYVDVWDEQGNRIVGVPVLFYWNDGEDEHKTEVKHGEPYSVNLPLSAGGNAYGVMVNDGLPSDKLYGVGLGSFVPHHSFRAIFQRQKATGSPVVVPPISEPPTPVVIDASARELVEWARDVLNQALEKMV